jgi:hypothetical protein
LSFIFISHVEEDAAIAEEIAVGLGAAGYDTWYYERDSLPGLSYLSQILEAIRDAVAIVVIISRDSMGSWQVDKEIIEVHESGKPFIPLLKDITHAEFRQRRPEWALAMGASTSTPIPAQGVSVILPRIIKGLARVGVPAEGVADGAIAAGARDLGNVEPVPVMRQTEGTAQPVAGTAPGTIVQPIPVSTPAYSPATPSAAAGPPDAGPPARPQRGGGLLSNPLTWVVGIGALAIVAVIVLVIVVFGGSGGSNNASATSTPLPTAVPTTAGQVLLQDNFNDPNAGTLEKSSGDPANYQRGYVNGQYVIKIINAQWAGKNVASENIGALGTNLADSTMAIDARLGGQTAKRYIVLGCRFKMRNSVDTEYRLVVYPGDGTYTLERFLGTSNITHLLGPAGSPAIHQGNAWNRLVLTCQGSTISASINGTQLPPQSDSTLNNGELWIGIGDDQPAIAEADFDNMVITKPVP